MGQQPNLPLAAEDLPRPEPRPGPPRRWSAGRPGDLGSPGEVPWGGAFGTPGPDAGYALRLLAGRELPLAPGQPRADAEEVMAGLMAARASLLGRAPVTADAEAAQLLLGRRPRHGEDRSPGEAPVRRLGHGAEGLRRLLESIDPALLGAPLDELRRGRASGEGAGS